MAKARKFGIGKSGYAPENPLKEGDGIRSRASRAGRKPPVRGGRQDAQGKKNFAISGAGYSPGKALQEDHVTHVGHKMVQAGKAKHPHWRTGKGLKVAKRMYGNADTAHSHTKVRP